MIQFETGGQVYHFTGEWRIPQEGHPLPAIRRDKQNHIEQTILPGEMIFESDNGVQIGIHPDRIFGDESYKPVIERDNHARHKAKPRRG